jgi:hypothetical protein
MIVIIPSADTVSLPVLGEWDWPGCVPVSYSPVNNFAEYHDLRPELTADRSQYKITGYDGQEEKRGVGGRSL